MRRRSRNIAGRRDPWRASLLPLSCAVGLGLIAAMAGGGSAFAQEQPPKSPGTIQAKLKSISPGGAAVKLDLPAPLDQRDLSVANDNAKLANARAGDVVTVDIDDVVKPTTIKAVKAVGRPVSVFARLAALAAAFVALASISAGLVRGLPTKFMLGADNRYSNSKSQMLLWFGSVATVYVAAVALRIVVLKWDYIGGIDLPQNLIVLTGLSAFTFGGAKVITAQKVINAQQAGLPPVKTSAAAPNLLTDLVQNDRGQADLGDFQMIMVSLAAVIVFLLSAFHFLGVLSLEQHVTLPDIDTTLLSGFGIGHGAYLVKKAAVDAGAG